MNKYAQGWMYHQIKNLSTLALWMTGGIINNALKFNK